MRRLMTALLLLVVACGGDAPTTSPEFSLVGTYTLQTVDGSRLPFVILQSGQNSISYVDDRITIANGGTWNESGTLRTVNNGQTTTDVYGDNGTWLRSGSNLVLLSARFNNTAYQGTFTDTELSLNDDTFRYVFRR